MKSFEEWVATVTNNPIVGNQRRTDESEVKRVEQKQRAIASCEEYIAKLRQKGRNMKDENSKHIGTS